MTSPALEDDIEEKPLDPAMEKVRRKMVRLMVVSIGIMIAGVMAVLFAVVYKMSSSGETGKQPAEAARPSAPGALPAQARIVLPAGATVNGHSLDGNLLSLDLSFPDGRRIIEIRDLATGDVLSTVEFGR